MIQFRERTRNDILATTMSTSSIRTTAMQCMRLIPYLASSTLSILLCGRLETYFSALT